ncbi:MAG: VWA domain-containing protein [Haloarculaceae archaeon]
MPGVSVAGATVGIDRPLVLLALPVAAAALAALVFRRRGPSTWGRRRRVALFATRLLVVGCLVVAAAGPYTVTTRETAGDPRVHLLVDQSASMSVTDADAEALAAAVEEEGVPVTTSVVAADNESRVGDAVAANLAENGSVLLLSDGQVTGGRSLDEVAELARSTNTTLNAVDVSVAHADRAVSVAGPATTSVDVENSYLLRVEAAGVGDVPARVVVRVDGTPVVSEQVRGSGTVEFAHTFEETGQHRITATVERDDGLAANDVYRKSVHVVEQPRVLYVSQGEYPLRQLLDRLYRVTATDHVPSNLSTYQAVVVQDTPASALGNTSALQRFVIEGGGLVVAGGPHAYEQGGYGDSPVGAMVPVRLGEGRDRRSRIVLLVDISGSTSGERNLQKSLALTVLDQLGDRNEVGLVAFAGDPYRVADVQRLGDNRAEIESRIRRLQSRSGTDVSSGLYGAAELLGDQGGNVILISDGRDSRADSAAAAQTLGRRGVRVVSVGVGERLDPAVLQAVAEESGGVYLQANETDRLRLLYDDTSRSFSGDGLTVVDRNHFVTAGVDPRSDPPKANDVSVKQGADFLVATGDGTPAVAAWRYGLGRVVSVTAYGADGTLDGLLQRPDSLLLSKSVNWGIGDPERGRTGVVRAPDARVGEQTTVRYVGADRPSASGLRFRRVDDRTYEATVTPRTAGYDRVLDAEYAVNYPREYDSVGVSPALQRAVAATGGQTFAPTEAAAIADAVTRQARHVEQVRDQWGWAFLLAALLLFMGEVVARRIGRYRGWNWTRNTRNA